MSYPGGDSPDNGSQNNGTSAPTRIVRCPTCRRSVPWKAESRFRPFCSERCQLIDLGAWADGQHAIPGDAEWADEGREPDPNDPY